MLMAVPPPPIDCVPLPIVVPLSVPNTVSIHTAAHDGSARRAAAAMNCVAPLLITVLKAVPPKPTDWLVLEPAITVPLAMPALLTACTPVDSRFVATAIPPTTRFASLHCARLPRWRARRRK